MSGSIYLLLFSEEAEAFKLKPSSDSMRLCSIVLSSPVDSVGKTNNPERDLVVFRGDSDSASPSLNLILLKTQLRAQRTLPVWVQACGKRHF